MEKSSWVWSLVCSLVIMGGTCNKARAVDRRITWTAPGDDGTVGRAAQYEIRWGTDSTKLAAWGAVDNATVWKAPDPPVPDSAGAAQQYLVRGLLPNVKYWVVVRTADEAANWSDNSNIPAFVSDQAKPAAIGNVKWD